MLTAALFLSLVCVRRRPIDGPRGGREMKMERGGVVVSLPGLLDGGDWETVSGRGPVKRQLGLRGGGHVTRVAS